MASYRIGAGGSFVISQQNAAGVGRGNRWSWVTTGGVGAPPVARPHQATVPRGRIASSIRSHCRSSGVYGIQRRASSNRIALSSERSHFAWHGDGSGKRASRFGRSRQNTGQIRSRNRPVSGRNRRRSIPSNSACFNLKQSGHIVGLSFARLGILLQRQDHQPADGFRAAW